MLIQTILKYITFPFSSLSSTVTNNESESVTEIISSGYFIFSDDVLDEIAMEPTLTRGGVDHHHDS